MASTPPTPNQGIMITLKYLDLFIWHWKWIGGCCFSIVLITALYTLTLEPVYIASTILRPSNVSDELANKLTMLAGRFGIPGASKKDSPQLLVLIIKSRDFIDLLAKKNFYSPKEKKWKTLPQIYGVVIENDSLLQSFELYNILKYAINAELDEITQTLTISVSANEPALAADIGNAVILELKNFTNQLSISKSHGDRLFIEARLLETHRQLKEAENKATTFREKNRKIGNSPQRQLDLDRLLREVKIQEEIFITLTREHEVAKIQENKQAYLLDVLERPRPPVVKSAPLRTKMVIMSGIIAFFIGIGSIIFFEYARHQRLHEILLTSRSISLALSKTKRIPIINKYL